MNYALRTAIGATTIAATLALTGCVKLDADVSLSGDDTFSGDVVIAFSDEVLEQMDMSPEEFLEGMMSDSSVDVSEYETEPYAEGGYSGMTATFEDAPLDQLEDTIDLTIDREGDEFVVHGEPVAEDDFEDSADSGMPELDAMLAAMRHEVSITFPGPVAYADGEVEGTTVSWESTGGEPLTIEARASALTQEELDEIARAEAEAQAAAERQALIRNITIGVGVALGAAVLVALGIFFGRRAGRKNPAGASTATTETTAAETTAAETTAAETTAAETTAAETTAAETTATAATADDAAPGDGSGDSADATNRDATGRDGATADAGTASSTPSSSD
ncbi:hypothetical protein GCM10027059_03990 [Myceligenerans halotolerans]